MLELVDWLRQNIPAEDSSGATAGLVHGDFRIDNLVFHPTEVVLTPFAISFRSSSIWFTGTSYLSVVLRLVCAISF